MAATIWSDQFAWYRDGQPDTTDPQSEKAVGAIANFGKGTRYSITVIFGSTDESLGYQSNGIGYPTPALGVGTLCPIPLFATRPGRVCLAHGVAERSVLVGSALSTSVTHAENTDRPCQAPGDGY